MVVTSVSTISMWQLALPDMLACVARLPADRVAVGARQLDRHGWVDAEEVLARCPVRVGSIGAGLTTNAAASDPSRGRGELELLDRSVRLAGRLGIPLVTLTTGPAGQLCWEDA